MAGMHNKRIYTKGDNPWCETCMNCEHIIGEHLLKDGAYLCLAGAIPTKKACERYVGEVTLQAKRRGHLALTLRGCCP